MNLTKDLEDVLASDKYPSDTIFVAARSLLFLRTHHAEIAIGDKP